MAKLVTAFFHSRAVAEAAVTHLVENGFDKERISLLLPGAGGASRQEARPEVRAAAAYGAIAGGTMGAMAFGLLGVGVIALPGVGLLATGPIIAALMGIGAGGAAGGLLGAAVGARWPDSAPPWRRGLAAQVLLGALVSERDVSRVTEILHVVGGRRARMP
jgi:hypothetical protein